MNFKKRVNGSWTDTPHYIHNISTDTITTLPAVIYANDTTATVGLKGNMSQSSIPSPQSPIQPSECGERTGNLWDGQSYEGYLKTDGTYMSPDNTTLSIIIKCEPNTQYAIKQVRGQDISHKWRIAVFSALPVNNSQGTILVDNENLSESTITTLSDSEYIVVYYIYAGSPPRGVFMVNEGSEILPYEMWGIKIPILSNSTTTNVYLGEVQSTRKVKKLEFDGTENWVHRSGDPPNEFFLEINTINVVGNLAISTHYINQDSGSFVDLQDGHILVRLASSGDKTYIGLRDSNYPATSQGRYQLKEWLADQYAAGTPVTIWYVLATPETAVVNEPIRKIGDYADEVSGITIPTIAGANTISIGTTLQPSELTVNYKGWHPVADVHERESGQWT